ncbi:MAG: DUF2961 domain-containing protein [Verrucomicrobiales bacterium]|nr:DUF2961 domain-containing protein [Verrucomicrobiales bacterium]
MASNITARHGVAWILGCWAVLFFTPSGIGETLTYVDLVDRLTNLRHLARLPAPGERCEQWSSYDRASRFDADTGKYIRWDANGDGDGFIRKEGEKIVMAEMKGPGCLWRIWSAAPKNGHVRIYLDDSPEPAVDLPFTGYFDSTQPPFNRPALVHSVALGWNNYVPIPYQRSCKIVADPGWGQYFHFGYSTFPADTVVPTFRRNLSASENAALDDADRRLRACGPATLPSDAPQILMDGVMGAGDSRAFHFDGPEWITRIQARLDDLPASPADRVALREVVLEIRWDGETVPSVWSPFGDFFGTAAGANAYRSLPCGLTEDGWWYCNWPMPYARSADVTVRNEGTKNRKILLEVTTAPLQGDPSAFGNFHAKWHRDIFPPVEPERQAIDWTLLKTTGRGRFVGVLLHIWNPRGSWWGEGDEKFYVDGERFPSTFGTGSEDYFGYAWSNPGLFQHAYHSQTITMNNRGHIAVNRWHVSDSIPFQTGFEGAIEKYFPDNRPTLYSAVAYWYQAGGKDPLGPVPVAERTGYWDESAAGVRRVDGAQEGEKLRIMGKPPGSVQDQDMGAFGTDWSGDSQLWWTQAKPGDRLEVVVSVPASGAYEIRAQFTKAIDYGIIDVAIDGDQLVADLDLYNHGVVPSGPVSLGRRTLLRGDHRFSMEIKGANPKAVPGYMVGLDYVKLTRAD